MKARIDWMQGGRVKPQGIVVTEVATYELQRVNLQGELEEAASNGAHTKEFAIYNDGEQYKVTYYNSAAANNYAVAYYDSNMNLLGGILGGNASGQRTIKTQTVIPPTGTRTIRAFCVYQSGSSTYNKYASVVPVNNGQKYKVVEIKVRPVGHTSSQIVWPTSTHWEPIQHTARLVYYGTGGRQELSATGAASEYARVLVTFREMRGEKPTGNTEERPVEPYIRTNIPYINIDGTYKALFYIDEDGISIRAVYLGKTETTQHSIGVSGIYNDQVIYSNTDHTIKLTVRQEENVKEIQYSSRHALGYGITLSTDSLPSGGGLVTIREVLHCEHRKKWMWTSLANVDFGFEPYDELLDRTPRITIKLNGNTVSIPRSGYNYTFPENTTSSERVYTVTGSYTNYPDDSKELRVAGQSGDSRNYENLMIIEYYYPVVSPTPSEYEEFSIPATGGTIYPKLRVQVSGYINGSWKPMTHQGYVANGATSITVYNDSASAIIYIRYLNGSSGAVDGYNKETNDDDGRTVVAYSSDLGIQLSVGNISDIFYPSANVYQQQNKKWKTSDGSLNITSFTVVPKVNDNTLPLENSIYKLNTANTTTVKFDVRASVNGTEPTYAYTTGRTSGGQSIDKNNEPVTPDTLKVDNVTVQNKQFSASNNYVESTKNYSITSSYGNRNVSFTIQQKADEKIDISNPEYVATLSEVNNSNSIWAGGGQVQLKTSAYYITGKIWESDRTPAGSFDNVEYNMNDLYLSLSNMHNNNSYRIERTEQHRTGNEYYDIYTLYHNDMTNNVTTDTITVTANNHNNTATVNYSVSNALDGAEADITGTNIVYGEPYLGKKDYGVAVTNVLFTNVNNPASYYGAQSSYTLSAYHKEAYLHNGGVPIYHIKKYTSYSAQNNSSDHYSVLSTTYDYSNPNYIGILVEGQEWEEVSDSASLSTNLSWRRINSSQSKFTIDAQTIDAQSGDVSLRQGAIIATNTSDPNLAHIDVTIYQRGYSSYFLRISCRPLTTNVESLVFEPENDELTFIVSNKRTPWAITHRGVENDAFISYLSPTSGGGNSTPVTVTVKAPRNTTSNSLFEEIVVSPSPENEDVNPVVLDVISKTSVIHYSYVAQVECEWISSTQVSFHVYLNSSSSSNTTFSSGTLYIYSTTRENQNPVSGELEKSLQITNFATAYANTTSVISSGTLTLEHPKSNNKYYWAMIDIPTVHSEFTPVGDENGE